MHGASRRYKKMLDASVIDIPGFEKTEVTEMKGWEKIKIQELNLVFFDTAKQTAEQASVVIHP